MTVNELKEYLNQFDGDMEVKFSYNYGDYWKTTVTSDINCVEEGCVEWSDYHRMDKLVDDENINDESNYVVILS